MISSKIKKERLMKTTIYTIILIIISSTYACSSKHAFDKMDIIITEKLQGEAAIDLATGDLSNTLKDLFATETRLRTEIDLVQAAPNSIFVVEAEDDLWLKKLAGKFDITIPALSEDGFIIKTVYYNQKPLILISGNGVRGTCYGIFHFIERLKIDHSFASSDIDIIKQPDMTLRMITQPFEAVGYPDVAKLSKPITQHIKREFDPMRPWEGAGYDPEDEARNILRSGLNAMWVGNFAFATVYDEYDSNIFPEGTEGGTWVRERKQKIAELMAVAQKYHLKTVASADVFIYPKGQPSSKKWDMLEYSLNEFLTNFPQIDMITTRFGENYSYYNNHFVGEGLDTKGIEEQFPKLIDFIYQIVSKKHGKIYMPRTWACGNTTWGSNVDRYMAVVDKVKGTENMIFSVKNTRTDFWRYNKFNPIIGVGEKEQAMEFLCQDGYNFKNAIPYYDVNRMANGPKEFGENSGMKKGYQTGTRMVWGWLSADGWCGPYLKREEWLGANIYGFCKLAWDVNSDPMLLAKEWAALEFEVEAKSKVAENIAEILMLSEDMILKSRYFHDYSMKHEGWLPSNNWIRDELIGGGEHSNDRLSVQKSFSPGTLKPIFNPATMEADIADKKEAAILMNTILAKFAAIKEQIPDQEKANEVYNTLLYGKYLINSLRYYVTGMFRYYNGEYESAAANLRDWNLCWNFYNNVIPELPGTASLMLDGGMVASCDKAMKSMNESYDTGTYPDTSYTYVTDDKAVEITLALPSAILPETQYLVSVDISHMDASVDKISNLKLTFTSANGKETIEFKDAITNADSPIILQQTWTSSSPEKDYKVSLTFDYKVAEKSYAIHEIIK